VFSLNTDVLFIESLNIVVLSVLQVSPAIHCTMVGNLNDPGGRCSFARVEKLCFLEEQNEDILADVFGFCLIAQYSACNTPDHASISAEKQPYGVFPAISCLGEQEFVTRPYERLLRSVIDLL